MIPLRVLVAEAAGARALASLVASESSTELIGTANNGRQAIHMTERLRPDVILLAVDIVAVEVFAATREIMTIVPTPIVIVVDESGGGIERFRAKAREAGAVAVVAAPPAPEAPRFSESRDAFIASLRAMAGVGVVRRRPDRPFRAPGPARQLHRSTIVAIGASTGGPAALREIFAMMPPDFSAPILVTQHISSGFSAGMVLWLDSTGPLRVKIAEEGEALRNATIYFAPDDRHLTLSASHAIALSDAPPNGGHRPSATVMFQSVAERCGAGTFAVILTGMGRDGVDGLVAVHRAGGTICAQDEATSAVYGMPKAAVEAGIVDFLLPLDTISRRIAGAVAS